MKEVVKNRIDRVIKNIRPASNFNGHFNYPKPLMDRLDYYHTPGISIAVINDFKMEWAEGFGVCDVYSQRKVMPDTLFQAASISKSLFALAVMRLVQENKLDLDEDINNYLSSWSMPSSNGWQPKITLRQLLSHTAGLSGSGFPGYQQGEKLPTLVQILNGEYPANTAKIEANIFPGLHFRYSGGGTLVAQQLMEDMLKSSFPEIMRSLVLQPLNMFSSTFEQPLPPEWVKNSAAAHPKKAIQVKGNFHIYPEMAAAGLWTTPADLAKVGIELLSTLNSQKMSASSFLAKEHIEEMLTPQELNGQIINQVGGIGLGSQCGVGLGFFCNGDGDGFYFGHNGWNEGFLSQMRFYKALGKGAIVMLNSNEGYPLLDEVMRAIGAEYEWPDISPKEKIAMHLEDYQVYAGTYRSLCGTRFDIDAGNQCLVMRCGTQLPLPIFPLSEEHFFSHALNSTVSFEINNDGNSSFLRIDQDNQQIKAFKVI